jgi:hypothetical protein
VHVEKVEGLVRGLVQELEQDEVQAVASLIELVVCIIQDSTGKVGKSMLMD